MLLLLATLVGVSYGVVRMLGLGELIGAGMFAGALTSTPGMAAIVDMVEGGSLIDATRAGEPVIGYSLAYPGAVVGSILVAAIGAKLLRVDHEADARREGLIIAPLQWDGVLIGPGVEGTVAVAALAGEIIATRTSIAPRPQPAAPTDLHEGMAAHQRHPQDIVTAQRTGQPAQVTIEGTDLVYKRVTVSNLRVAAGSRTGHRLRRLPDRASAARRREVPHADDVTT